VQATLDELRGKGDLWTAVQSRNSKIEIRKS
jgi:hypothetical protein